MPRKAKPKKIIIYDIFGYADANEFQPKDKYELVMVQDEKGKEQQAWWDGMIWDMWPRRVGQIIVKWRELKPCEWMEHD